MRAWCNFGVASFAATLWALLVCSVSAMAADISGARDFPGLPRFAGSSIVGNQSIPFDRFRLPMAPVARDANYSWQSPQAEDIEGKVSGYVYALPPGAAPLEVVRNYESALKAAGFEIVFACDEDAECGDGQVLAQATLGGSHTITNGGIRSAQAIIYGMDIHYRAAKRETDGVTTYVSLFVGREAAMGGADQDSISAVLHVIEPKPMDNAMVFVDADAMASAIGASGHIALYGIYFDTDSAVLKPESDPTLAEIAALLQSQATLKIFVVGHTDSQGAYDYNMGLSEKRARAVADALSTRYGIAKDRLRPAGVGLLSPVETNETEAGRAKNRRVELVRQ